ncbi:60S ribosomal protein L27, mitochondrial [Elasticomyces elasticus]|nr:60S ribosomal protein L27, mitochondrial [Elasticomyces elasticus]KAK3656659.1 60S ribosomal protein L27, mitochondrial [Elasticomyces elasticus]KAK4921531.1 60S ribosomal protein L27, mitochondrial [Elasticomyces elasticus]KAK5739167.1 60S ribosomal protein L27, mitochondrial [Elasticomyces elasticus]KAK5760219.1 60S ribosomal protein L27, mitochondrial [Elasticomyces elasticus]
MQPTPVLQRAIRRLALTTKQGPHNFYKGNRTGAMGSHTKYGGYRIDWKKVRTYVCPEGLGEFNLTPFVAARIEARRDNFAGTGGPMDGREYLRKWKAEGGNI